MDQQSGAQPQGGIPAQPVPQRVVIALVGSRRRQGRADQIEFRIPIDGTLFGRLKIDMLSPAPVLKAQGLLTGADALLWKADKKYMAIRIRLANVDSSGAAAERKATVSHCRSGVAVTSDTNTLMKSAPIAPGDAIWIDVPGMDVNESFYGSADTTLKVNFNIYVLSAEQ